MDFPLISGSDSQDCSPSVLRWLFYGGSIFALMSAAVCEPCLSVALLLLDLKPP